MLRNGAAKQHCKQSASRRRLLPPHSRAPCRVPAVFLPAFPRPCCPLPTVPVAQHDQLVGGGEQGGVWRVEVGDAVGGVDVAAHDGVGQPAARVLRAEGRAHARRCNQQGEGREGQEELHAASGSPASPLAHLVCDAGAAARLQHPPCLHGQQTKQLGLCGPAEPGKCICT